MSTSANSQTQEAGKAKVWVKPDQVDAMRSATVQSSATYLASRNDAVIATLYDTGLRVSELVDLDVDMLHLEAINPYIGLPAHVQKDYPTSNSPTYTEIELAADTTRTLQTYLNTRWKNPKPVFPSRQSPRMTTESVRNVVEDAAVKAEIQPYRVDGRRGDPEEVSPHTLRHSVAYRMMAVEDEDIYAVKKRLRHSSLQTTDRVYSHFDRV